MKERANLDYIHKLAGEDLDFRNEFIGILKDEFPSEKKDYENNIQMQAFWEASQNVHKIKHKINILGLHESHALATRHEAELRNRTCTLDSEFLAVLKYMATYLKSI